jgi:N-acetylmuramoyl-L-alanine amidase
MASAIYRAFRDFKEKSDKKTASKEAVNTENTTPKSDTGTVTASKSDISYTEVAQGIKFQVQILTSSKAIPKKSSEFKGLDKVDEYFSGKVYKYMAGSTPDFQEAKDLQKKLREMGFKDAFIVAFKNGERMDLNEAIRQTTK